MFRTGWQLNPGEAGEIDSTWTVYISDNYGNSTKSFGRPLASEDRREDIGPFQPAGPTGVYGAVSAGLVLEWDGSICYSKDPSDLIYIS